VGADIIANVALRRIIIFVLVVGIARRHRSILCAAFLGLDPHLPFGRGTYRWLRIWTRTVLLLPLLPILQLYHRPTPTTARNPRALAVAVHNARAAESEPGTALARVVTGEATASVLGGGEGRALGGYRLVSHVSNGFVGRRLRYYLLLLLL